MQRPRTAHVQRRPVDAAAVQGFLQVVWENVWSGALDLGRHDAPGLAAELAYRVFVAVVPGLLFLSAAAGFIVQAWGGPSLRLDLQREILRNLPPDTAAFVRPYLVGMLSERSVNVLSLGLLLSFWTSSSVITTVMKAATRILGITEQRTYVQQRMQALLLTTFLPLLFLLSGILTWFRAELRNLLLAHAIHAPLLLSTMRNGMALLVALIALAILLRFATPKPLPWRPALAGATVTVAGVWIASELFGWYAVHFIHYRSTYGLLGGALALVTWFYVCAFCLLVGLEALALLQARVHQR